MAKEAYSLVTAKKKGPPVEDDEAAEEGGSGDYASVKSSAVADLMAAFDEGDKAGVLSALSDFVEACVAKEMEKQ